MQYIAMLWTEKKGKLLQVFGPYPTPEAANAACDRLADWPAIKDGTWEVVPLHANPKEPVHQDVTQRWTGGTITLYGQTYPTDGGTITFQPNLTPWNLVTDSISVNSLYGGVTVTGRLGYR